MFRQAEVRFPTCRLGKGSLHCKPSLPVARSILLLHCPLVQPDELVASSGDGGAGEVVQKRIQMETGVAGQERCLSGLGSGRLLQRQSYPILTPDARPQALMPPWAWPGRCGEVCCVRLLALVIPPQLSACTQQREPAARGSKVGLF